MARELLVAESWERVYDEFQQVNFSAFDYNSVKQSLLDYIKQYHPENFNDYIEDSEMIILIEAFAYITELLAYRYDINAHENFMSTAQRKQSVLRLAKYLSYSPTRNLAARGLVKITSVTTTESVFDSRGINLANTKIIWNDPNNPYWKEQFFLVMNRVLVQEFGSVRPSERVQVDDVVFELYKVNNQNFQNGVLTYNAPANGRSYPMEIVPVALNGLGPYERRPLRKSSFSLLYGADGIGDASDTTGFFMYTKQGVLRRLTRTYDGVTPNQTEVIDVDNINDTDVWLNNVNPDTGEILDTLDIDSIGRVFGKRGEWVEVDTTSTQNILFNTQQRRNKYEIETLEDDQIKIIFGDGEFADIPNGTFDVWVRQSANENVVIPKMAVVDKPLSMRYTSFDNSIQTLSFTFSLVNTLSNASESEDIDTIKRVASTIYATQNRMVNPADYNTYPLRDTSILKLRTFNRTYAGHSRYMTWHDASGNYEDVKIIGSDLLLVQEDSLKDVVVPASTDPAIMILNYLQPTLVDPALVTFHSVNNIPAPSRIFTTIERAALQNEINEIEAASGTGYPIRLARVPATHQGLLVMDANGEITPSTATGLDTSGTQYAITLYVDGDTTGVVVAVSGAGIATFGGLVDELTTAVTSTSPTLNVSVSIVGGNLYFQSGTTGPGSNVEVVDGGGNPLLYANLVVGLNTASPISPPLSLTVQDSIPGTDSPTWRPFRDGVIIPFTHSYEISWVDSVDWDISYFGVNTLVESPTTNFHYVNNELLLSSITAEVNRDRVLLLAANVNRDNDGILGTDVRFNVIANPTDSVSPNIGLPKLSQLLVTPLDTNGDGIADGTNLDALLDMRVSVNSLTAVTTTGGYTVYQLPTTPPRDFSYSAGYGEVAVYDVSGAVNEALTSGTDYFECDATGVAIADGTDSEYVAISSAMSPSNLAVFKYDYVYYQRPSTSDPYVFVSTTESVRDAWFANKDSANPLTIRKRGRAGFNFLWVHITPRFSLVNPSPTNIHDMYVITKGYYSQVQDWLENDSIEPTKPTPLQLKNDYAAILDAKMMSDTVVLHSGDFKILFGSKAAPELRGTIKVVKSTTSSMTDNEIKVRVVEIVRDFFDLSGWEFGETFYFSELAAVLTARLAGDVKSAVLVPEYSTNVFGDLYEVPARQNEIFQPHITIADVELVSSLSPRVLRQSD